MRRWRHTLEMFSYFGWFDHVDQDVVWSCWPRRSLQVLLLPHWVSHIAWRMMNRISSHLARAGGYISDSWLKNSRMSPARICAKIKVDEQSRIRKEINTRKVERCNNSKEDLKDRITEMDFQDDWAGFWEGHFNLAANPTSQQTRFQVEQAAVYWCSLPEIFITFPAWCSYEMCVWFRLFGWALSHLQEWWVCDYATQCSAGHSSLSSTARMSV